MQVIRRYVGNIDRAVFTENVTTGNIFPHVTSDIQEICLHFSLNEARSPAEKCEGVGRDESRIQQSVILRLAETGQTAKG